MLRTWRGLLAAALMLYALSSAPASAQSYVARDGNGALQTFAAKIVSGIIYPYHVWTGLVGGTGNPQPINTDTTGNIGVIVHDFQVAPTVTVQNAAYAAGNAMGGLITVSGVAQTAGGPFTLGALRLRSVGGATNTSWIYAWTKTPAATCTDKAAYVANAADNAFALPGFPLQVVLGGAPGAWDTSTFAQITGLSIPSLNQDTSPGTAMYVCIVTAGAVTPATTADLSLILTGWN